MIYKNILIPDNFIESMKLYSNIVESKQLKCRNILSENESGQSIFNVVSERYHEYHNNYKSLENITARTFLEDEKKCLKGCYDITTKGLTKLVKVLESRRNDVEKSYCYYCGFGEPDTLDHYLPKGEFPEFSVLINNLIPCCSTCNRIKGENWIDEKTKYRKLVNFYYDEPEEYQILKCKIEKEDDSFFLSLQLAVDIDSDNAVQNIIYNHISTLELITRLESKSNTYLVGKWKDYQSAVKNGIEDAWRILFNEKTKVLKDDFGSNYWKYVINLAIIDSKDFGY
ncbi:HNH endonuclease [Sporosarcina beigongshangi]|uniref:HNH endonuclease n=1 Tax=Sporosarcina beigongshangi TaxID=2782538 RepID=UPI00193A9785|nr:hypothetical protein [Sporosarcina beigongshangi]